MCIHKKKEAAMMLYERKLNIDAVARYKYPHASFH